MAAGSVTMRRRPRPPMSKATRDKRERFERGDLILSYGQPFECFGAVTLSSGRVSQRYRLLARCDDCTSQFWQVALRSDIKAERLRRRCDDCKEPMRVTKPVARYAGERRRQKAAEAEKLRLDALHLRRIQKLSAAMGQPVPPDISLGDLLQAEQRHIRKTRLAHQRAAWMLGVPLSEIAKMDVERRARRGAQAANGGTAPD